MNTLICILMGGAMGFLSGLIGVGGGIIAVPGMMYFLKMNIRDAMGTSLAVIVLVALSGAIKQVQQDHVAFPVLLPLAISGIVFAWIGAHYNNRVDPILLQRLFAIFVLVVALKMLADSFKPKEGESKEAVPAVKEESSVREQ